MVVKILEVDTHSGDKNKDLVVVPDLQFPLFIYHGLEVMRRRHPEEWESVRCLS